MLFRATLQIIAIVAYTIHLPPFDTAYQEASLSPNQAQSLLDDVMADPGEEVEQQQPEAKKRVPNEAQQKRIIDLVQDTFKSYSKELQPYRDRLLRVYQAYSTYQEEKHADWATTFKVNKAHEIVEKILPRVVAKNPRWIVSPRMGNFYPDRPFTSEDGQMLQDPTELRNDGLDPNFQQTLQNAWVVWLKAVDVRMRQTEQFCQGIQDYLTYIFDEYKLEKYLRKLAKNMITYGKGMARIRYHYEVIHNPTGKKNEYGEPEVKAAVKGEYPTIDVKSWTDMLWDPAYGTFDQSPALIERLHDVRYVDIKRHKGKYFNLDKLDSILNLRLDQQKGMADYREKVRTLAGLQASPDIDSPITKNNVPVIVFYGLFDWGDDGNEMIYEISCVGTGDTILFPFCVKRLTRMPFVECDAFEDPELNMPVGFVEPIISLQDELNYKKNAASEYINMNLNRQWYWSPQSGINPKHLISRPNGIIVTTKSVIEAEQNCKQISMPTIDSAYFQEQNDFERQIQSASFTVDTSNQRNQQALTNTATGIRVAFFESNSVIDECRKHWEQAIAELAYQLLLETFENMDENIVLKKIGQAGFWEMNKELLRDAVLRYSIKVEANSSSFDDIESRRDEQLGFWNVSVSAKAQGVNVDLTEIYKEVIATWEKKDPNKYVRPKSIAEIVAEVMGPQAQEQQQPQGGGAGAPVQGPEQQMNPAAQLTDQVAQGDITSAIPS